MATNTNKLITIQLFKYDEKTSEKCQHYTTAAFNIYDGNYEKLLKESIDTNERPVRFYSSQFVMYVKSEDTYCALIKSIGESNLAEIYLYSIMDNDPFYEGDTIKEAFIKKCKALEKSRKRRGVSDKENCGPTSKKAKSQSRATVLQSQNSNNNSARYNSGDGSKGFSKANQKDIDKLFGSYKISQLYQENPNPQYERFLSIFGLNVSDLNFEPPKDFTPISKSLETQEYDSLIQQLKEIFTDTNFRIKNVQKPEDGKPYKLAVPITNGILTGKTDAVIEYGITTNRLAFDEYLNVVALIEFKTCDTFYKTPHQGIFEYIGACIRGTFPVIYVQTDMRDFRFLVISRNAVGPLVLYDYLIQSPKYNLNGFVILNNWLNLVHSIYVKGCRDQSIIDWFTDMNSAQNEIKKKADDIQDSLKKNSIQTTISKDEIINAYKSIRTELICDEKHSRTGRVYKIHINDKAYALKVPRLTGDQCECEEILKELRNEADIYYDVLNRVCDVAALWPRLHYRGDLEISEDEKWPFVILTSYLEGRKVNLKREHKYEEFKKWEYVVAKDYTLCENTLTSLNKFGIWHGDARTSNFVIVCDENGKERAKILDFGFSQRSTELTENLKDDEMVNSYNFT